MEKLQIFEGLNLPMEACRELAYYWKAARRDIAIIRSDGKMIAVEAIWNRPCASESYEILRTSLEEKTNKVEWIVPINNMVIIDFDYLHYDDEKVRSFITRRELGICDGKHGLELYEQVRTCSGKEWYTKVWELPNLTVNQLNAKKSNVVCMSPDMDDPYEAEWKELYFMK